MRMDELAEPAIEAVSDGRVRFGPENYDPRATWTGCENIRPWCISRQLWWGHQIPVWYRGRGDLRRHHPARRRRLGARPGRARHLVLQRAVAVRDARLARADAGAAGLLSDRRARDRARHHLPVGRADDHDGARVHRRDPVRRRLHPLDHPGARRPPDVEVARDRDRSARSDRRRPAAARVRRGRRVPRLRRRRRALGAARDVLRPGRALQRGEGRPGPAADQQALERVAADPAAASTGDAGGGRPGTVEDRWILSRLERAKARASAPGSSATTSRTRRSSSTTSSTASCATGTSSWSSRGSTTAIRTLAQTLLHVLTQTLALAHPMIPFVTEEIYAPRARGIRPARRAVFRRPTRAAIDEPAEAALGARDRGGPGAARLARPGRGQGRRRLSARLAADGYEETAEHIARLARLDVRRAAAATRGLGPDPRRRGRDPRQRGARSRRRRAQARPPSAGGSSRRSSAPSASWPTRASSPRPRPRSSQAERTSSRACAPSWRRCERER